jgi:hypothetical protein
MNNKVKLNADIESEIIKRVIEYVKVNNHEVQALWFGEENNSCGAILSVTENQSSGCVIKFKEKIVNMPAPGNFLILRVFFLFAPILGRIKKINNDKSVHIDELSFVTMKNNKRRYPRFLLRNQIESQMMIGNHVHTVKINDISKDGIGFLFSSEKSMMGLAGKSGFIQLNYNNILLRVSGNIVWINRFSQNEYIGGMMLFPNNQDKDIITDIIFDNIFTIESEIFKFISFAAIGCGKMQNDAEDVNSAETEKK